MTALTFRGGRLPADPSLRRIHLTDFIDIEAVAAQLDAGRLPDVPAVVNWDAKVSSFGMLGNDDWGDCAWAAKYHALQVMTANAGTELVPTTDDALRAYAEATGFNAAAGPPGENPTDQGTVMQKGLSFWRKTGLPVTTPGGVTRHKILAFAEVDHRDPVQLRVATALFGEVLLGIAFPSSAMDQFNAGTPWKPVAGARDEGGHAICAGRYDAARGLWFPVTWGREQETVQAFLDRYLEEAWVVIAPEWRNAAGKTPTGIDLHALGGVLSQLTGEPNPIPAGPDTPPEPPAPHAVGLDAAARALAADPGVDAWLKVRHASTLRHVADLVGDIVAAVKAGRP